MLYQFLKVVIIGLSQSVVCKCLSTKLTCFDINDEPAGETRIVTQIVLEDVYVFGERKEVCSVSRNEHFKTQITNMHCSVQQRLVDFTGVNDG
jgi:hypothetical protein